MKKILLVLMAFMLVFTLSACDPEPDITIEPDTLALQFENPEYDGEEFIMDVYLTNGYHGDVFVGDVIIEAQIYDTVDGNTYVVASSYFDFSFTLEPESYEFFEVTFYAEGVFMTEEVFSADYDLDDVFIIYEINPVEE